MFVGQVVQPLTPLWLGLREDLPVAVTCSVGHRAGLAVSILLRHGFQHVSNVLGGMTAWRRLDLPVREGPPLPGEAVSPQATGAAEHEVPPPPPP